MSSADGRGSEDGVGRFRAGSRRRDATVLDVVERALEQQAEVRAEWLTHHCPAQFLDLAERVLRAAEATNGDEDVSLALLLAPRT
jgi:hypothetical protein